MASTATKILYILKRFESIAIVKIDNALLKYFGKCTHSDAKLEKILLKGYFAFQFTIMPKKVSVR